MEKQPQKNFYHDTIAGASSSLEFLGHSLAFEKLLQVNALERSSHTSFVHQTVESRFLPAVMNEVHAYPVRFSINNFEADFTELPDEDGQDSWYLSTKYTIGGNDYRFWANQDKSVLETANINGETLHYNFSSDTAGRFLMALASSALDKDSDVFLDAVQPETLSSAATLKAMLKILGERLGVHKTTLLATFEDPEHDRALIVKMHETETPNTSSVSVDYHMGWEVAAGLPTAMLSTQREVMGPQSLANRYAERRPTQISPDQMFASLHFGPEEDATGVVFTPSESREQYDLISACIMRVLEPRLVPYRHFDR